MKEQQWTQAVKIACSAEAADALRDMVQTMAQAYDAKREQMRKGDSGVPAGYVRNAKGWLMPEGAAKSKDLLEDRYVRDMHLLMASVAAASKLMRLIAYSDAEALVSMIVGDAGGDGGAPSQGKVTLQSLDATRRVTLDRRETVSFGPEVAAARDKVMACVRKWSDGANANLVSLAMAAFAPNGSGDLSVGKVAALWRIECQDEEWQQAMAALKESLRATGTSTYIRFHERQSPDGAWALVDARV
jgi:hypothetical protein